MAYSDYDSRYEYRPGHEYSFYTARDTDAYSKRPQARPPQPAMSYNYRPTPYYSYEPRYAAPPPRVPAHDTRYRRRWPPSPSVEDETTALAREVPSAAGSAAEDGEAQARGSVDQYPIIEEIEQPANDERRYVLVPHTSADDGTKDAAARDRRRRSFAERGNMAHLKTDLDDDPPLFTKRTPSPYAYTKPQKESLAPSPGEYFLSPDTIAPSSSSVPRTIPTRRDQYDARDQNARPAKQIPVRTKHTSSRPPSPTKKQQDVFEDSDADSDTSHLRTERRPARYSFVKSDLQKEDLRTNVLDSQAKSERRRRETSPPLSARRDAYATRGKESTSSGSSKQQSPTSDSPRSSSPSLHGETRKSKPAPIDTNHTRSSRYPTSRPSSPRFNDDPSQRSPRLPPRRPASPSTSRPSPRSERPPSPLHTHIGHAQNSPRMPVTEADWHSTYPPVTDRSRPTTRPERYETMPIPTPKINVKSPSPARPRKTDNPLPYPMDDRQTDAFMPPEENYQYDHSYVSYTPVTSSPRPDRLDSPVLSSPRERQSPFRPQTNSRQNTADEIPRSPRVRSNSVRSQTSTDGGWKERKSNVPLSLDRPLPSCPRTEPGRHNDWYTLQDCSSFDICPSCYEGVFADTPFARYFSQSRRYERPTERICDFSSPWMRLAWLLTIKQRRQSPDLIYSLAKINEQQRGCPGDRELGTDHITWYGVSDPRDGVHVTNFALCACDLKMIETLFPSMIGYFTRLPSSPSMYSSLPPTYTCSLRVQSRRFPKYLDLLVALDAEAQALNQHPHIHRFVQLARENAFKSECQRDKQLILKAWHFPPALPELTVCQECFEELVWPHLTPSASAANTLPSTIPNLFNRVIQPVPTENEDIGSSCCLYSPRMRQVWDRAVRDEDFQYLERKTLERKAAEARFARERRDILGWMAGLERGSYEWEKAKGELRENEEMWKAWE